MFESVEFTPEEEDLLDEVLIELGYATAEDLAEERRVPLNLVDSDDPDVAETAPDEDAGQPNYKDSETTQENT